MWQYLDHHVCMNAGELYLCNTCHKDLAKEQPAIPKLNTQVTPGMRMNEQPAVLQRLNDLEATLVRIYTPFMSMFTRRTRGAQWAMQGSVANVPLDVYKTQDAVYGARLPHMLSDTQSILLRLKRKLLFKGHYMAANIRPGYVMAAMRFLVQQPLYTEHGIEINEDWLADLQHEIAADPRWQGYCVQNPGRQPCSDTDSSDDTVHPDAPCCMCGLPDCTADNDILFCDSCNGPYHMNCVGLQAVPSGQWQCAVCAACADCSDAKCGLCGKSDWQDDD